MANASDAGRRFLLQRLQEDLIGPGAPDEVMTDRPSDRYLTGILFPPQSVVSAEEDERLAVGDDEDEVSTPEDEGIALGRNIRPSTIGVSFAARGERDEAPSIALRVSCGVYTVEHLEPPAEGAPSRRSRRDERWTRRGREVVLGGLRPMPRPQRLDLTSHGLPGLEVYLRAMRADDAWSITVALVNCHVPGADGAEQEQRSFFQVGVEVRPEAGTRFVARPSRRVANDEDSQAAALIYRDACEYAVGHSCAATWQADAAGAVTSVASTWMPSFVVQAVSAEGDGAFRTLSGVESSQPLDAAWLAQATDEQLVEGLGRLPAAYDLWLDGQEKRIASLPARLQEQARKHIATCRDGARRMREAVTLVRNDEHARTAFRLAQRAMDLQRMWSTGKPLQWRPFQLGFQLLTMASVAQREHRDRAVMDLLWFPTGGGKTEAYLGLIAFLLMLRRLRDGAAGDGVAVIMRYTLRLLTVQQFERAATLICACEHLRRGQDRPSGAEASLGDVPFSIGLWVGGAATPATVKEAHEATVDSASNPRQLSRCPVCRQPKLRWGEPRSPKAYYVKCGNKACAFAKVDALLPVWTVDDDVYRVRPSLVIGTVDKFAQIVRNEETGKLFALDSESAPPDLIIQDELHLISGPLGTVTALYEIAIDELCSRTPVRPKVIGSTATIRRAEEQVRALFNRSTYQFPPPCIDAANSGFAVQETATPGRLYVGLSTAGRSPKFALQAACASLLQAAHSGGITDPRQHDAYWSLVAYFNSLRELGGALVMMMDDVPASIDGYAARRAGERGRSIEAPLELTSRVASVRPVLDQLEVPADRPEACDVVLASNMISVGVDVPRLGVMAVNGQPKGIAEYIQATSRVGRGAVPGLVVTVYNDSRARDRSHFESFRTWHQTLYREVEATSVTPFAARALDRAAHAVLVALARHKIKGLKASPRIKDDKQLAALRKLADVIVARAEAVDRAEAEAVRAFLDRWVDEWWEKRATLEEYWNDSGRRRALLMSAEVHAARVALGSTDEHARPTPNSMREVEPGTMFALRSVIRNESDGEEASDGAAV